MGNCVQGARGARSSGPQQATPAASPPPSPRQTVLPEIHRAMEGLTANRTRLESTLQGGRLRGPRRMALEDQLSAVNRARNQLVTYDAALRGTLSTGHSTGELIGVATTALNNANRIVDQIAQNPPEEDTSDSEMIEGLFERHPSMRNPFIRMMTGDSDSDSDSGRSL